MILFLTCTLQLYRVTRDGRDGANELDEGEGNNGEDEEEIATELGYEITFIEI